MKKNRIGIIGCGGMAKSHAARMNKVLEKIEFTAVVDSDGRRTFPQQTSGSQKL